MNITAVVFYSIKLYLNVMHLSLHTVIVVCNYTHTIKLTKRKRMDLIFLLQILI